MKNLLILLAILILPFVSFSQTKTEGVIVDIDGNVYHTVSIGDQIWLKENLKVTKYNNGDPIALVTDTNAWTILKTPAYCNYNNNEAIAQEYGRMYNYYVVVDDRKVCPTGTHVPSDLEWEMLCNFLGGKMVAGGKLKESGTEHWNSPNVMAINTRNGDYSEISPSESGFNALPAGRQYHSCYTFLGFYTELWSTTPCEYDTDLVWCRYLTFSLPHFCRFTYKKHYGLSIRCIKD